MAQVREHALRRFGVLADLNHINLADEASVPGPLPGEGSREFVRRVMLAQVEAIEATATYKREHAAVGAVTLTEEERIFLERGREELLVALRGGELPPPNVGGTRYRTWPAFLTGLYAAQVPLVRRPAAGA